MFFKKEEKSVSVIRVVLTTIGIILALIAVAAVVYRFFKKHFKITFECGDCEFCEDDCFVDDADYEPECCVYDGCCDDISDAVDADLSDAE